jgi:alpha-amylase/alpha-mannosidase (GH57 family)
MPHIYVCFLWHMHQPCYKDMAAGEYRLPWTRMHALKDYYGMVKVLEEFPEVRQTFNLVPSLLMQVEEYAAGKASDPFLRAALKPAEELIEAEQDLILQYFFQANVNRLIRRYPRYAELYEAWLAQDKNQRRVRRLFGPAAFRDLQVLSQLAWFDEEFLEHDPETRALVEKGRDFSLDDQALMGRKQLEIQRLVIPTYKEFAQRGQIEISTTPFYHPILPLLCDSDIARVSHPGVPLPTRFNYPQDAKLQLERAIQYIEEKIGRRPVGLWPSEGSVSDETLEIAADVGFKWAATDNDVLSRTLGIGASPELNYRPYLWRQGARQIHAIFRDHYLSDLVGFVYSRMSATSAAAHLLERIHENCAAFLSTGRDALVPIILDGENAWEHFEKNGRPFLRELYGRISQDPLIRAVTISDAIARMEATKIDHIFPASWINANFDVWIGAEEDNKAWEYLFRARQTYETRKADVSEASRQLASEELLIAEGSDWCWWYGPEHDSENRREFDQLYRDHLANVYRALGISPPEELSRPILQGAVVHEFHEQPQGPIHATIDGEVTSYFEWLGAGLYRVDERSGAMHGHRFLIREMRYGSDGENLYVRLDFEENATLTGMEARFLIRGPGEKDGLIRLEFHEGGVLATETTIPREGISFAYKHVLELRVSLAAAGIRHGEPVRLQLSLWQEGLPMDALPQQGWLEMPTAETAEWPI